MLLTLESIVLFPPLIFKSSASRTLLHLVKKRGITKMAKTTETPTISAAFILAAAIVLVAFPIKTSSESPAAAPGSSGGGIAAAPGPGSDCFSSLLNLSDCLTYVETGSNQTKPDKGCCPELKNLVETQPVCLCELLAHPDQSPFPIDLPKAIGLPAVCKVDATPSLCSVLGVPVGAPAPAPASGLATAGGPSAPGASSTGGSASSPSTSPNNGHGGQGITASQRHFLVGLAVALFISFF